VCVCVREREREGGAGRGWWRKIRVHLFKKVALRTIWARSFPL
jgi:hypothetical protein